MYVMIIIPGEDLYRKRELEVQRPWGTEGAWLVWGGTTGPLVNRRGMSDGSAMGYEARGVSQTGSCMASKNLVTLFVFFLDMVGSHWTGPLGRKVTWLLFTFFLSQESLNHCLMRTENWESGGVQFIGDSDSVSVESWGQRTDWSELRSAGRWGGEDRKSRQLFGIALQERVV